MLPAHHHYHHVALTPSRFGIIFPITIHSDLFLLFPCHQLHIQSHRQPLHKYMQITGVFSAQPMEQSFTNICKYRSILSTANSTASCPCIWLKIASQSELSYFLDGSKNRFNSLKKVNRLSQVLKIGAALSHIHNLHYKIT